MEAKANRQNKRNVKPSKQESNSDHQFDDPVFQQILLDQLSAYGDRLLGEDDPSTVQNTPSTANESRGKQTPAGVMKVPDPIRRKKRRRWVDEMELTSYSKKDTKDEDLTCYTLKNEKTEKEMYKPEVVVFRAREKKAPVDHSEVSKPETSKVKVSQLSHEVYQFGLSGFDYQDKEKIEVQRAIKLGAKPPKNPCIPYKELMKLQRVRREEELKQREIDRKMGMKVKKRSTGNNPKKALILRKTGFWQDPSKDRKFRVDGQVGRYRQGVQVLNRQDIHHIKKSGKSNTRLKMKKKSK